MVDLDGPLQTVDTVTGTSTTELNSTVQVRLTEDPTITVPSGEVTITDVGDGTVKRNRERWCGLDQT